MLQRGHRLVPGTMKTPDGRMPRWIADIMRDCNRACLLSFALTADIADDDDAE
jgi:hypothetical protein